MGPPGMYVCVNLTFQYQQVKGACTIGVKTDGNCFNISHYGKRFQATTLYFLIGVVSYLH